MSRLADPTESSALRAAAENLRSAAKAPAGSDAGAAGSGGTVPPAARDAVPPAARDAVPPAARTCWFPSFAKENGSTTSRPPATPGSERGGS